jgi:hypothetical protein
MHVACVEIDELPEAGNVELQHAVQALDWHDRTERQAPAEIATRAGDFDAMSYDQLARLAELLLAELAQRQQPER